MFMDKNGDPWLTLGPNFYFTIVLYIFVTGIAIILLSIMSKAKPEYWYYKIIIILCILFCYFALSLTVFLNPGHISKKELPPSNGQMCRK
mmetsp:Transcript_4996/g.4241  ORF Transcript_4996/g.4241 Transcript_4996/m.4241 type:complete len:90 (+) Transcript_4996:213-482(+)